MLASAASGQTARLVSHINEREMQRSKEQEYGKRKERKTELIRKERKNRNTRSGHHSLHEAEPGISDFVVRSIDDIAIAVAEKMMSTGIATQLLEEPGLKDFMFTLYSYPRSSP